MADYIPALARVDPKRFDESNPHSFNRYAYANNNPYRFVDPDGRIPVDTLWDAANVVKGAVINVELAGGGVARIDAVARTWQQALDVVAARLKQRVVMQMHQSQAR